MSDTHTLPLGEETDRYLHELVERHEADREAPLELDWDGLRPLLEHEWWSKVLVNTLLRDLADATLQFEPPDEEALEAALRAALPFALVNRAGALELEDGAEAEALLCSTVWRRSWTPGTRPAWVALLGESPEDLLQLPISNGNGAAWHPHSNGNGHANGASKIEHLFGDGRAIFVNPHRSGRTGSSESIFPLVACWLANAIDEQVSDGRRKRSREALLNALDTIFEELIQNIRGHAVSRGGEPVFSLVKVILDNESATVRIGVQDTGPGILTTVRLKLREPEPPSDEDLLPKLFRGELPSSGRARGIGLPKVWSVCQELGAELTVASGLGRLCSQRDGDELCGEAGEFAAPGVAISLTLPLLAD